MRAAEDTIAIPMNVLRGGPVALVLVFAWQQRDVAARALLGDLALEIDPQSYQAVFLTGGQVYFGKLAVHGDVLLLEVYYLSKSPRRRTCAASSSSGGARSHGPREPMIIPKAQLVFVENGGSLL